MHPVEIEKALETMKILVDTREHPGKKFSKRMKQTELPYCRVKLDFGDYSAECQMGGMTITLDYSPVEEGLMITE